MPELQDLTKEKITFIKERCLTSRNCNVNCSKCADICPASVIKISQGEILFDQWECDHCGGCRTVCPSEAFTVTELSFLNEICNISEQELPIGCSLNDKNRQDFNVRCYAFLTEGELLYLLSKKTKIIFSLWHCETCKYSAGCSSFVDSAHRVQELTMRKDKLVLCHDAEMGDRGVSRRLFFEWFKQKAKTALASTIPIDDTKLTSRLPWRRETFLVGLKGISDNLSENIFVKKIDCDTACSGCGGCVTVCPTGAFTLEDHKLSWQAKNCLNCDLCLKSCPEKALHYGLSVKQEEFWQVKTLREFLGKRCTSCGNYFKSEKEQCDSCSIKNTALEESFELCINRLF